MPTALIGPKAVSKRTLLISLCTIQLFSTLIAVGTYHTAENKSEQFLNDQDAMEVEGSILRVRHRPRKGVRIYVDSSDLGGGAILVPGGPKISPGPYRTLRRNANFSAEVTRYYGRAFRVKGLKNYSVRTLNIDGRKVVDVFGEKAQAQRASRWKSHLALYLLLSIGLSIVPMLFYLFLKTLRRYDAQAN